MINELYPLSVSMKKHNISAESFHRKYKPIPNVSSKAPCIHIILSAGQVVNIKFLPDTLGKILRKYGTNNGTYPGLNLTPLYRINEMETGISLKSLKAEALSQDKITQLKGLCTQANDNWDQNILTKYRRSLVEIPKELQKKLSDEYEFSPLSKLIAETELIAEPEIIRKSLQSQLFKKLDLGIDLELALRVLFQSDNDGKPENLSVYFDCKEIIENGIPAASELFVSGVNQKLMASENISSELKGGLIDAFGFRFDEIGEKMPSVKLAGGFDATLRTMFNAHLCQFRYGKIEDGSYPISSELRIDLQTALDWIGGEEHKNITWTSLDKNVILFAYPHTLPKVKASFTQMFKLSMNKTSSFETEAKQFISNLRSTRQPGDDSNADRIQFFILKKIDKARTKVVLSIASDANEIEILSSEWTSGCRNLPAFSLLGRSPTLFPSQIPSILNRVWKMDGTNATDKFKPVSDYHGVELLLDADLPIDQDLLMAVYSSSNLASYAGSKLRELSKAEKKPPIWWGIKNYLSILGLLLYRKGIRKEDYMEDFPYQYGQLLKVSDELHALYCKIVRNGEIPPQLAGSGIYPSAVEAPIRSLHQLSQRMNPYLTWARSYQYKNVTAEGVESWRARWYLSLYEPIVANLYSNWDSSKRFNDAEKAQMFIGYLAAFAKREGANNPTEQDEE